MLFPPGFLGTRADLLMDVVLIAMLATPFILIQAIRLARRGAYLAHRNIQTVLLAVLVVAVVLFEVDVRTSGGSGTFLGRSAYAGSATLKWLLRVHITVAVTSFLVWSWVVIRAWRDPEPPTPARFGPAHRRTGYLIFAGVTFTSASGAVLYWLAFVS